MLLQLSLLHFSFLLLPPSSSSASVAKRGCPDRCGTLSIPYPFGVGPDCSMEQSFDVICNASFDPPKAYLSIEKHVEIIKIEATKIRVNLPNLALSSYGKDPKMYAIQFELSSSRYTFSDDNWLTAVGCDDMASVTGQANRSFSGGCVSYCQNRNDSGGVASCPDDRNGLGLGTGCCRTPIPKGTTNLYVNLTDVHKNWRDKKLFSTSYAFAGEKVTSEQSQFRYLLKDLDNFTTFRTDNWWAKNTPPLLLDWRIGTVNCNDARRMLTTTYACQVNSDCVDFPVNIGGYLCECSKGYEGNPYLQQGCQDIDECRDTRTNPCDSNSICTNVDGSVICSCPRGYSGDGRKNGKGCLPSKMISIFIGIGSGLGFLLLLSICVMLLKALQKRKAKILKQKFFKQNGGLLLQQRTNEGTIRRTQLFLVEELEKATDNFNKSRILGQGGQGIVYKGMLSNGIIVAIKKSKCIDRNQLEQFINEVIILSQINHRNIVKLLGCCLETEVPLLIYEFLPNGTLSDLIHDPMIALTISWRMRLKMAADIAGALAYLHSATSTTIYHRDIKSSNILLDEKYVVKVSDFGISRTVSIDRTHLTTRVQGTFGYFDPEYFQSNQFTEKSDVYSFGVVLVELLTGQKPISSEYDEGEESLVTRFLATIEDNNVGAILDPHVSEHGAKEEVSAVVFLARRCLNLHGKIRPTMREVVIELESLRLSKMPANESEETRVYEAKNMMISDSEYAWTDSDICLTSDAHPLKLETV